MYRRMVLIRQYEDTINNLFLQGLLPGTIHQAQGQEATAVGACMALRRDDYVTTTHRPAGHCIAKGMSVKEMMAEMYGKATGSSHGKGGSMHLGDMRVGVVTALAIVGAGIPVTAGIGLAFKMKKTDRVALAFFGDGAMNEGAFHEGANMAAIWNLPVILLCENNFYAASTHISKTNPTENMAARGAAYNIPSEVIDGNDVLAVYQAVTRAVQRARSGSGASFIECQTYRRTGHSRSDPNHYRIKSEQELWYAKDPIPRFGNYLTEHGIAAQTDLDAIHAGAKQELADAIEFAMTSPEPLPTDALLDVFSDSGASQ
jgi:pyruvate dehydrogenase E1 component alpha subunit